MSSFDVLTIGAAVQDILLKSDAFEEKRDPHAPDGFDACVPLGAKIALDDLFITTGGGATNAAVTFSRFGWHTACIARVGQDQAGQSILAELKQEKVDTAACQVDAKRKTAHSIVLIAGTGHRAILTHRGAGGYLSKKDLPWPRLFATSWYITSLVGDLDLTRAVFAHAKKTKSLIAWNPGNSELALGRKKLEPFLRATDLLLLNREEAATLAALAPRHLEAIAKKLGELPTQALIVTDGERGAYVFHQGRILFAPPLEAKRLNALGAGDAFGSACAAFFFQKHPIEDCLRAGMLNATSVITHMGAKAGILKKPPTSSALASVRVFPLPHVPDV